MESNKRGWGSEALILKNRCSKDKFSLEPFVTVLEWFDSQVSMEEVYRFPLLRLIPFDVPPPFVIPAKAGIQRWANGKAAGKLWGNAIHRIVPDLDSRFRGNDGKRDCVYTTM